MKRTTNPLATQPARRFPDKLLGAFAISISSSLPGRHADVFNKPDIWGHNTHFSFMLVFRPGFWGLNARPRDPSSLSMKLTDPSGRSVLVPRRMASRSNNPRQSRHSAILSPPLSWCQDISIVSPE
jgi:hypothetical protein